MIDSIAALDKRIKAMKEHYPDPVMPIESGHALNLLEHVEMALLQIALLEKKLENDVG